MSSAVAVSDSNGNLAVDHKPYPPPLASHNDVIKDSNLFWGTLRSFHRFMGTKYMIPVIGGKELDLHVLYNEVTKRGGFDKVVTSKKWREVGDIFMFSTTTTSASNALRKHYFNLLYHYEKVHFFKPENPPAPSGPMPFQANGRIDAKFEHGYLVTLHWGKEILNGVLYHSQNQQQQQQQQRLMEAMVSNYYGPHGAVTKRRRRKKRNKRDPNHPKPNRSGYNFYFAEKHAELKASFPLSEREFTKMIGNSWNNLTPQQRSVYQNKGANDKERYLKELAEYKERINIRPSASEEDN